VTRARLPVSCKSMITFEVNGIDQAIFASVTARPTDYSQATRQNEQFQGKKQAPCSTTSKNPLGHRRQAARHPAAASDHRTVAATGDIEQKPRIQ
jgi:hypothetical protein